MKPFTKDIVDKRKLTKHITKNNMYYNQDTIEKNASLTYSITRE